MGREQKTFLSDERKKIISYNMKVIQEMWKKIKGGYGKNVVRGNIQDRESLYWSVGKSRQTIREIIYMEKNLEEEKTEAWAESVEKRTGIAKEYLTGKEYIKLGEQFEEKFRPKYEEYIEACDIINEHISIAKENPVYWSEPKLKKWIAIKREKSRGVDNIISTAEKAQKLIEEFNKGLASEIEEVKQIGEARKLNEDSKRYRLVYFITNSKPYDDVDCRNIEHVMKVMDAAHTAQLKGLGEAGLRKYIGALEKQLKLAEAVYAVAVDCGDFKI